MSLVQRDHQRQDRELREAEAPLGNQPRRVLRARPLDGYQLLGGPRARDHHREGAAKNESLSTEIGYFLGALAQRKLEFMRCGK